MRLGWYASRLRRMSPAEVSGRLQVAARQRYWAAPHRRPAALATLRPGRRMSAFALPRSAAPPRGPAAAATIAAGDALLAGRWPIFHLDHTGIGAVPDWFADPLTGVRAPAECYAFAVPYRDEARVGNIKFVWELSRHQATTVLAAAWWLTGEEAYAARVAAHLTSWWQANPFLSGVHWTSGIEVGLRLLSWTWIRALLADWPGMAGLLDDNPVFAGQLYHHQLYARGFYSRGSSANNHVIAELAGLSAAATAFPWFEESAAWAGWARTNLVKQAALQTHADGFNREQASDYHVFVLEMLLAAVVPARLAGAPFAAEMDATVRRMADALAASLDSAGRPPRFGDGDDARGVLLDAPQTDHVAVVLDAARALYGAAAWWPPACGSLLGHVAGLAAGAAPATRNAVRPGHFDQAGITIMRAGTGAAETWLRCDAGPHGFLSIAAHGHADALSIELRCGGVDVLADPGTYCYHGEPEWRGYFKGTRGHNTLQVDGFDQAEGAGPFLWLSHPRSVCSSPPTSEAKQVWSAHHDGYARLPDPVTHHRRVTLEDGGACIELQDWIDAGTAHAVLLAFHFGPAIRVRLAGAVAHLDWAGGAGTMALPPDLSWQAHRGEAAPPMGWYSAGFGHKTAATMLAGRGDLAPGARLQTVITLALAATRTEE